MSLISEQKASEQKASEQKASNNQRLDSKSRQLLLIDDEEAIRIILKASLELTTNWTVLVAASSPEGMVMAQAERPDAILLDVMMPQIDGITLFHQLRAQALTRHIPVVFLTAQARVEERQMLEVLGTGVITKPFEPTAVADQIRALLGWT